jgi:hypothetical protein
MTRVYKRKVSIQEFSNIVGKIERSVGKIRHSSSLGLAKLKNGEYVPLWRLMKYETLSEVLPKIKDLYGEHEFILEPYVIKDDKLAELLKKKKLSEEIWKRTDARALSSMKKRIIMEYFGVNPSSLSAEDIDEIASLLLFLSDFSYKYKLKEWFSLKLSRGRIPLFPRKYNLVVNVKEDAIPFVGKVLEG